MNHFKSFTSFFSSLWRFLNNFTLILIRFFFFFSILFLLFLFYILMWIIYSCICFLFFLPLYNISFIDFLFFFLFFSSRWNLLNSLMLRSFYPSFYAVQQSFIPIPSFIYSYFFLYLHFMGSFSFSFILYFFVFRYIITLHEIFILAISFYLFDVFFLCYILVWMLFFVFFHLLLNLFSSPSMFLQSFILIHPFINTFLPFMHFIMQYSV